MNFLNAPRITNKRAWLWSRDCFKILPLVLMQRDARVCQRQLSCLFSLDAHNYISGMAEARVAKRFVQVEYIKC